jgi:cobalamin synthase
VFIKDTGLDRFALVTATTVMIMVLPVIWGTLLKASGNATLINYGLSLPLWIMAALYVLCLLAVRFFRGQFGGLTGDTLGAVGEIAEIIFLMVVLIWSRLYTL